MTTYRLYNDGLHDWHLTSGKQIEPVAPPASWTNSNEARWEREMAHRYVPSVVLQWRGDRCLRLPLIVHLILGLLKTAQQSVHDFTLRHQTLHEQLFCQHSEPVEPAGARRPSAYRTSGGLGPRLGYENSLRNWIEISMWERECYVALAFINEEAITQQVASEWLLLIYM